MDHEQELCLIIMMYICFRYFRPRNLKRKRENISTNSGNDITLELLRGNNKQCIEFLRMSHEAYVRLIAHFRATGLLKDSTHASVEEKLAIFLFVIGANQRFAAVKQRFQRSAETINKIFSEVLAAMRKFAGEVISPTSHNPSLDLTGTNMRLRQIFKGAVGAVDGMLIHAVNVPAEKQSLYKRSYNGKCCQYVMAVCDFNMIFTYMVAGWEGVAEDTQVLDRALVDGSEFPLPPADKYYLCDTGYKHTRGFMTPYRNVRYSLKDFCDKPAMNKNEEFNHAHAKLRNVIERAFGVLKARFPVLKNMISVSLTAQRDISIACFAIHNFIRKENIKDPWFAEYDQEEMIFDEKNEYEDDKEEEEEEDESDTEDDEECDDDPVIIQIMDKRREKRQFMVSLREEISGQLMQDRATDAKQGECLI